MEYKIPLGHFLKLIEETRGKGRCPAMRSSTRATRSPEIEVSTSMTILSSIQLPTTFRQPAIGQAILHEIHRPGMVGCLRH